MAIDFYVGPKQVLSVSEKSFHALQPSLNLLVSKTGRTIDPYGTTTLAPSHARIWLDSLRDELPKISDAKIKAIYQEVIGVLAAAIQQNATLLVEGE
ncbi:MAG: hypothetical protein RL701_4611 [Pseudomonadota bacterium]|jgi:hypothetical protein